MNELLAALMAKLQDFQAGFEAEIKAAHDAGFAEGAASVAGDDKIFSQADMDAAIAPLNAKIDELNAMVLSLQSDMEAKIAEAVSLAKADLLASIEAVESIELESIRNLLK